MILAAQVTSCLSWYARRELSAVLWLVGVVDCLNSVGGDQSLGEPGIRLDWNVQCNAGRAKGRAGSFLPFSMRCNLFFLAWPDLTVSFSFFGEGDIPTKLHLQLISIDRYSMSR